MVLIHQHFNEEERPFVDRVLDWKTRAEERFIPTRTDFLDPRRQDIIRSIIGVSGAVRVIFSGGYDQAERKRAIILPPYSDESDFSLAFFELVYPQKFVRIEHPNLLGALLSLGIKRDKLGDILVEEGRIQWVCAREIRDYVRVHLTEVGRQKVSCREIEANQLIQPKEEWEEKHGFVTSLRLDVVISEIFHLSRAKAQDVILAGKARVNWKLVDKPSLELEVGDLLSVRGFGRARLDAIKGMTKRGHLSIDYSRLK